VYRCVPWFSQPAPASAQDTPLSSRAWSRVHLNQEMALRELLEAGTGVQGGIHTCSFRPRNQGSSGQKPQRVELKV
jgi:hypothetical protein